MIKKILFLITLIIFVTLPCYAEEQKPPDKAVMGIVTITDIDSKAKFDAKKVSQKKYTFDQFVDEFNVSEPIKQAFTNKYMSRSVLIESNNNDLVNNFKNEYVKHPEILQSVFTQNAEKYNYDYILVNVLKFNRIEKITGSAFLTLSMQMYWQIDSTNNCYLYDTKNNKIVFTDTITNKVESQYPAGSWLYHVSESAEEDALRTALDKISKSIINQELKKLPVLQ